MLLLIAVIPPACTGLISAYFSYKASVMETKAKAAEAKRTAEKGYEQLVKAVELLQSHDTETLRSIAELNGHIKSIEAWMVGMRPHLDARTKETHLDLPVPRSAPDQRHWRPNFPPPVVAPKTAAQRVDLPKSLDEAAKK